MIKKISGALILLFGSSNLMADISVEHTQLDYIVAGHRIALKAKVKTDDSPIDIVRTYFKSSDGKNFVFVDMKCEKEECSSILPATKKETKAINYIFLIKDENGKVVKTQTFTVKQKEADVPDWQKISNDNKIMVKTELKTPPDSLDGFDDDNMVIDAVAMATKYGVSVGISGSGGSGAGATGTTVAKMGATGVTNGGTVTATSATASSTTVATTAGISTTTMVVGGGVAAAAGVGVALASSSGGGDDNGDDGAITENSTIKDLKGGWKSKGSHRTTEQWNMVTHITNDGDCTYSEYAYGSGTNGICTTTLAHGVFTFRSDGGANFSGNIIGKKRNFCIDGHFANGDSGQICWTKQ